MISPIQSGATQSIKQRLARNMKNMAPVTERSVRRKGGEFYIGAKIKYHTTRDGEKIEMYVIPSQEICRIRTDTGLVTENRLDDLQGRIGELISVRWLYTILRDYKKHMPRALTGKKGGKQPILLMACFKKSHELVDLYIPFIDEHVSVKTIRPRHGMSFREMVHMPSAPSYHLPQDEKRLLEQDRENADMFNYFPSRISSETLYANDAATSVIVGGGNSPTDALRQMDGKERNYYPISVTRGMVQEKQRIINKIEAQIHKNNAYKSS